MAQFTLKINALEYQARIQCLQADLNNLDQLVSKYESLENKMESWIESSDANFDATREQVRQNIKACQSARSMCQASIDMLQQTLQDSEEFKAQSKQALNTAMDLGKNTISAAVEAVKLMD